MYVYRTAQFNQNARQYGVEAQLDRLCAELEMQNVEQVQAHFERIYPYLKRRFNRNLRLIAKILTVGDDLVLSFLAIFGRGDSAYQHFLNKREEIGQQQFEAKLDLVELQQWLVSKKESEELLPDPKALLPDELRPWLQPPGWETGTATGIIIYECEEWLTRFNREEIQNMQAKFHALIYSLVNHPHLGEKISGFPGLKVLGNDSEYVLFSFLETDDIPTHKVLVLLSPFEHQPSFQEIAEVGKLTRLFDSDRNLFERRLKLEELTPFARRSYPDYLLADDESWLAIEGEAETNLALSGEEEAILNSVSQTGKSKHSLPIFLNGQAGSGKSTMLSYLFANYCNRKYYNESGARREQPLPGNPLFLTYNERLLEVVKTSVAQLLSSHHQFIVQRHEETETPDISSFFKPFQTFLLDLLPNHEKASFNPEGYISFHRFKQLYRNSRSFRHKQYSPEIAWHVIRTFIKGYSLDGYMEPEEYQDLPRRERSIPVEQFQQVYQSLWQSWYSHLTTEQDYWDDQDLIRKVLELNCYSPEYTAVFCDEAQDFTRLELQLIMRLSIFSQYDLGKQPIASLPFAFAGDPFQTLNPTGFRWESVRATFYNEVIALLDPVGYLNLGMNFQELERNYRSSSTIVGFNNTIQLWRHLLFKIPEVKPQIAWQQNQFSEPKKFILGRNILPEEINSYITDTIIIVPCEEGEEIAYARNDAVLGNMVSPLAEDDPPKNILSAVTAKGLEFNRVILYKFGEACSRGVWQLIDAAEEAPTMEDEYFFNKLYVAASRATKHLFIVDSETGDNQLWQYATEENLVEEFLSLTSQRSQWENSLQRLNFGTTEDAEELRENDPLATAKELKLKGFDAKNTYLLRRAKQFYHGLGNKAEAAICEAWALKFEERFQAAGDCFISLGNFAQAWECFWQGMCWSDLLSLYSHYQNADRSSYSIIKFMVAPADLEEILEFTQFLSELVKSGQVSNYNSKQFKTALEAYTQGIVKLKHKEAIDLLEWQSFAEVLEGLEELGDRFTLEIAGNCFYSAKNSEGAVRCWEKSDTVRHKNYYLAKAATLGNLEGLEFLEKAGETAKVVREWIKAGQPRDANWLKYVVSALEKRKDYKNVTIIYRWLDNPQKVIASVEKVEEDETKHKLIRDNFNYFLKSHHWSEAIETAEAYLTPKNAYRFVAEVSLSGLTSTTLSKEQRDRYHQFIKAQVLSQPDWQEHLPMQSVGAALEKVGLLVETLRFYENFTNDANLDLRQFARERWLATKLKQVEYLNQQGQLEKVERSQLEAEKNARKWKIKLESVSLDVPIAQKRLPAKPVARAEAKALQKYPLIEGLPANTTVETLENGVKRFHVGHLAVKVLMSAAQVLIKDTLSSREVRVHLERCQVKIGEAIVEAPGQDRLSFQLPGSGYQGIVFYDTEQPRLEITFLEDGNKIAIYR